MGLKKVVDGWWCTYIPQLHTSLDVDLDYTFEYESRVFCARFSPDGRYFSTACNNTAQIYDLHTGKLYAF
jgi:general transcriptional corepressor TUP1